MKIFNFGIPLFDVDVRLIQSETNDNYKEIVESCAFAGLLEEDLKDIEGKLSRGFHDGGELYWNFNEKRFLIVFYNMTNEKDMIKIYMHEKRHLEDRILEFCSIHDMETAAYLSGYLGVIFYNFLMRKLATAERKQDNSCEENEEFQN